MVVVPAGSFIMGSPENEAGRRPRGSTAQGDHPPAVRCRQVRNHFGRVARLRGAWRMRGHCGRVGPDVLWLVIPQYLGGVAGSRVIKCVLGRGQAVCGLDRQADRQALSTIDRSGMGVRSAGGKADGVFMGRRDWHGQRQLQRLRQQVGQQANGSGRLIRAQCVWALRYARQRLGVGRGLLQRQLQWRANGRLGVDYRSRLHLSVSSAAVPRGMCPSVSVRPAATGTRPASSTTTWVFALRVRLTVELQGRTSAAPTGETLEVVSNPIKLIL